MGAYATLSIARYNFIQTKGDVVPELMVVFSEIDKRTRKRKPDPAWDDEDGEINPIVEYATTVGTLTKRVEALGFSMANTERAFLEARNAKVHEIAEELKDVDDDFLQEEYDILSRASFSEFLAALNEIKQRNLSISYSTRPPENERPLIRYMLDDLREGWYFGFPCEDIRELLRSFLSLCKDDDEVVWDVTELVDAGIYSADDDFPGVASASLTAGYPFTAPIVVLAEGSTDQAVLKGAMELLYPDFASYYSFMDFGAARVEGGAGALVAYVKSFIGAGIRHRVVALFDNDTAGKAAMAGLSSVGLPENFRVLSYPRIEIAENYPTLGPTGLVEMDVNGLAGSIELYLGRDVLEVNSNLMPVQWLGYDQSQERYQGVLLNKGDLQARFFSKLAACLEDKALISSTDWSGIRAILESLFKAFTQAPDLSQKGARKERERCQAPRDRHSQLVTRQLDPASIESEATHIAPPS